MSRDEQVLLFMFATMLIFILLGREIICWYLKINKRIDLLESILAELKKNNKV